jgi:peptidoglycan/LPS O-acetylase OafA/YrhL
MKGPAGAPRRSKLWAELEGYRIAAALIVVAFHIRQHMQVAEYDPAHQGVHIGDSYPYQDVHWFEWFMTNADVLIDLFFAMSGFLLVLPFARAVIDGRRRPGAKNFVLGKLLRYLPLYWLICLVSWTMHNYGYPGQWLDLAEHLTVTQWLDSKRIFYTIGPAWSLADEIWFMASVPLIAWAAWLVSRRLTSRGARALSYAAVLAVPIAASIAWKYGVAHDGSIRSDQWSFTFGVPAKLDTFCFGSLSAVAVAWMGDRRLPRGVALGLRAGSMGLLLWLISHRLGDLHGAWNIYAHTYSAACFAVLLTVVATSRPGVMHRLCDNRLVLGAGSVTFALYISHEALLDPLASVGLLRPQFHLMLLDWAIGIPIALACGWLLHHGVEEPALKVRAMFDRSWRPREYYPDLIETVPAAVPAAAPVDVPRTRTTPVMVRAAD